MSPSCSHSAKSLLLSSIGKQPHSVKAFPAVFHLPGNGIPVSPLHHGSSKLSMGNVPASEARTAPTNLETPSSHSRYQTASTQLPALSDRQVQCIQNTNRNTTDGSVLFSPSFPPLPTLPPASVSPDKTRRSWSQRKTPAWPGRSAILPFSRIRFQNSRPPGPLRPAPMRQVLLPRRCCIRSPTPS